MLYNEVVIWKKGGDIMKKIRALMKYTKNYRGRYLLGIFFLLIVDISNLVPPKLIGAITDGVSSGNATLDYVVKYIVLIVVLAILVAIGRFMWRIFIVGTSRHVEYDIRKIYFTHLQKLSINFYNKNKTGDLMALATNDLNAVRMALGQGVIMLTDAIVLSITTIIIMLTINVRLTLLSLIPLPLVAIVSLKFGTMMHRRFMKVQEVFSKLTDVVQENFSGIRIIKSFVQEEKEYEKFTKQNQHYLNANMNLIKIWGVFQPLIEFISALSFVLLIGIGGISVIRGEISLGEFITFNMYLGNLVWPMMAVGWVINIVQRGFASLERIEKILSEEPDIYDGNTLPINSLRGDIEINDLTFTYPGSNTPALNNINLHIKEGQTLGIIGRTGSGKSTLVNLLVRLYNVEENKIVLNGCDINKVPLEVLRENIGFAPQDAFLFSSNIAENINLAYTKLDMEKVYKSAQDADIYDNIMDFPDQFNTAVGERGVTLSGGQKQRVTIARALIKEPDVLIFDDCLSAVDANTETKILANLKKIMEDRTSIIISHRISAVKDADHIIVMEDGKITEEGTHNELINKQGLYDEIYKKQLLEQQLQKEDM